MLDFLETLFTAFADLAWGYPLLALLTGGGLFFMIYSRFAPFFHFKHAFDLVRGKFDNPDAPGEITHFQALMSALASTVGMGNISGVAVAIMMGGPGAIFWMWVSAFVGMATKFHTCALAIMYRGKDTKGQLQGGPMYVIMEGLGTKWKPLAVFFAIAGLFGPLPIFQANQLTAIVREVGFKRNGINPPDFFWIDFVFGVLLVILVSLVIFGGIKRIAKVASRMVPLMVVLYVAAVVGILAMNVELIPGLIKIILVDAFTADAAMGGAVGSLIIIGVRRASFSNEAGIGTEALAHGAARTDQPIREGLVAMFEPLIDTIIVCTMTALAILITGTWKHSGETGIAVTLEAFISAYGGWGSAILLVCVLFFALSSLFTYSYYGTKCFSFLFGAERAWLFNYFYVATVLFGAVASIQSVISLIDGMYAMMAIPTMTSALILAPKVRAASIAYFAGLK
jgi:AGCS family alanine or glycine:cation symporter